MTPSGIVSDNDGGKNYTVTFVTVNTGVITQSPLTITASANTKYYDGTASALAVPQVTGLKGNTDSVTVLAETYNTSSAGTNLTLSVSPGYSVNDGNGGNNYHVTTATSSMGVINRALVAVSITGVNKTYDTTPLATATCTVTSGVITGDLNGVACTVTGAMFGSSNAGTWAVSGTVSLTGGSAGNYSVASVSPGAASIGQYLLAAAITAANKPFDGTPTAAISSCSLNGVFRADLNSVSCSASGAAFSSSAAGTWPVTANVSLGGSAAGNYTLTSSVAATTATISDSIDLRALSLNSATNPPPPIWTNALNEGVMALQLANAFSQTTSAWLPVPLPVSAAFSTTFQFQISAEAGLGSIGDGFAFVIQGVGSSAVGTAGAGAYIGYSGISNSIAIEFDTYNNSDFGDPAPTGSNPSGSHLGIQSAGANANDSHHNSPAQLAAPVLANFADGTTHTATITYDGNVTLRVFLDNSQTPATTATLTAPLSSFLGLTGNSAYVGFTAATGAAKEDTDLLGWSWN
jgi:hypothetical protein